MLFYSETEMRQSGYPGRPLGQNLFECRTASATTRSAAASGRRGSGPVDLEIAWPGDFLDRSRELRIRVQSARRGGFWLFIERDMASAKRAAQA